MNDIEAKLQNCRKYVFTIYLSVKKAIPFARDYDGKHHCRDGA